MNTKQLIKFSDSKEKEISGWDAHNIKTKIKWKELSKHNQHKNQRD